MWKTIRRETGLIEHICEHGVGHPNAGSVQYMEYVDQCRREWEIDDSYVPIPSEPYTKSHWWVHGCDGCCSLKEFPGSAAGAIKHAIQKYRELEAEPEVWGTHSQLLDNIKHDHFLLWWGIMAALNEARDLREEHE